MAGIAVVTEIAFAVLNASDWSIAFIFGLGVIAVVIAVTLVRCMAICGTAVTKSACRTRLKASLADRHVFVPWPLLSTPGDRSGNNIAPFTVQG